MTARRPRIVVANIAQSGMDDWSLRKWDCDEPAASPSEPPDHTLVEICWRVRTPSLAVVVRGIYQDSAPGVVLRATFEHGEIVRVRRTPHAEEARLAAAEWLDAIHMTSGFKDPA
jgi:hypothetical protein